jgi:hypothetical protein
VLIYSAYCSNKQENRQETILSKFLSFCYHTITSTMMKQQQYDNDRRSIVCHDIMVVWWSMEGGADNSAMYLAATSEVQ